MVSERRETNTQKTLTNMRRLNRQAIRANKKGKIKKGMEVRCEQQWDVQ